MLYKAQNQIKIEKLEKDIHFSELNVLIDTIEEEGTITDNQS